MKISEAIKMMTDMQSKFGDITLQTGPTRDQYIPVTGFWWEVDTARDEMVLIASTGGRTVKLDTQ